MLCISPQRTARNPLCVRESQTCFTHLAYGSLAKIRVTLVCPTPVWARRAFCKVWLSVGPAACNKKRRGSRRTVEALKGSHLPSDLSAHPPPAPHPNTMLGCVSQMQLRFGPVRFNIVFGGAGVGWWGWMLCFLRLPF